MAGIGRNWLLAYFRVVEILVLSVLVALFGMVLTGAISVRDIDILVGVASIVAGLWVFGFGFYIVAHHPLFAVRDRYGLVAIGHGMALLMFLISATALVFGNESSWDELLLSAGVLLVASAMCTPILRGQHDQIPQEGRTIDARPDSAIRGGEREDADCQQTNQR